jgi:hypothetical protein
VDHDVEPALCGDDLGDRMLGVAGGADVELERIQRELVLAGVADGLGGRSRVAAGDVAHAGVDDVAGAGEGARSERAEAAGCAGDQDDIGHGLIAFF